MVEKKMLKLCSKCTVITKRHSETLNDSDNISFQKISCPDK